MKEQSASDRLADTLRTEVIEGRLRSDERLKDLDIAEQYGVSRNTARDALRTIVQNGLATARLNSGVSVRRLGLDEVRDIYEVRRLTETAAIGRAGDAPEAVFEEMRAVLAAAATAARQGDWRLAGTQSVRFHQSIIHLAQSPTLDAFFANIVAQLRLVLAVMPDEEQFQRLWPERDVEIYELIRSGQRDLARHALTAYLDDAESRIVETLRAQTRLARVAPTTPTEGA